MNRKIINISNYMYVADLYDANTDLLDEQYVAEFVMLRNFTLINNVACDTDIYFIERSLYFNMCKELRESEDNTTTLLTFPIPDSKTSGYSRYPNDFNDNYIDGSLYVGDALGLDVYEILGIENSTLKPKKILCDKIRIYHPIIHKYMNAVISIENYINNIHFHYLCRPWNTYKSKSETEFKVENNTYSEFIEVWFPNIDDIFKVNKDGTFNTYYKEDLNIVASTKNEEFINSILVGSDKVSNYDLTENVQIVPMNLLIQPFRIIQEIDPINETSIFAKLYLKTRTPVENNHLVHPINLTLFPYDSIDETTNIYMLDEDLPAASATFIYECKFAIKAKLGFSDGILSVINTFDYPTKEYFDSIYGDVEGTSPLIEAYKYYNDIKEDDYTILMSKKYKELYDDIEKKTSLSDYDKDLVRKMANMSSASDTELLKTWKRLKKESIEEEFKEEYGTTLDFLGYRIRIASDVWMKNVIYTDTIPITLDELDDFCFKLNGIFEKWYQLPESLVIKTSFIDRCLGIELPSNFVTVTKEWFKYMINDPEVYRLSNLTYMNDNMTDEYMKEIDLADNHVNFINNINCVVHKENEQSTIGKSSTTMKVLYKPIFYRVNDLQSIRIRTGLDQNIGVNLVQYMTKVETFNITLGNREFKEIGRNDVYVIFNIKASELTGTSGTYNITDGDGTYISSGNWSVY